MSIVILPILNVSEKIVSDLKAQLGNTLLSRIEIVPPIPTLRDDIYDREREQYDASKLVSYLDAEIKSLKADKIIAVGNLDLFMGDMNFIFGVAQKGGRLCVISLYRLDQRFYEKESSYDRLKERAVKEAVHELGHCYGLDHCDKKGCVMSFSDNIMLVDAKEPFFCEDCREKLRKAL